MGIKCPKCHFDNPDDTVYCGKCATPLPSLEKILASQTKTLYTPVSELARGTTFADRYEFVEELGKGGMGRVYKVFDTKIREEVALKLLKPEISDDEKTIERFTNELKFSRKIVHKNVCRMYDLGEEKGTHYITMEYVPGEDLKSFIKRAAPLSIGKSISIARQICEGLSEAHSVGVVHRDLKPGNIMIDKEGNARIMDFGIARSLKAEGITSVGVIIGTPEYMSPEQVEGKATDQRSDIYSLGVILYEMMTGRVPFEGDTSLSIVLKHKTEIPKDPRELSAQIPETISHMILRCMAKKKEDRYQSVNELLNELDQINIDDTQVKEERKRPKLFPFAKPKKESKPAGFINKILKYRYRALVLLLIVYVIISIVSLLNDAIYNERLEKITVESNTYYRNLFPIEKYWLPEEWKTLNCNACNAYMKLFPPREDEEGNRIPEEEYLKNEYVKQITENPSSARLGTFFLDSDYNTIQELKTFINNYGGYYKFDELFDAVKCNKLNPFQMIEKGQRPNGIFVAHYVRMIILKARIDFLEGNYEKGLIKIRNAMVFVLDFTHSSSSLFEDLVAIACFRFLCQELIPLFLSDEVDFSQNSIKHLHKLIALTLEKFEPELIYYKEYLWIGKVSDDLYQILYSNKFNYYLFEKFRFWKHGFSYNRYLSKTEVEFYKKLLEGLKFIRNNRDKSIYMYDYFEKNATSFILGTPSVHFKLNVARTLGKLALAILTMKKYGMNSPEFSDLERKDVFINELSGKKFEIIDERNESFIVLDENYKLNLKKIDYKKQHKQILKSFKHFHFESMEQIRSIFYSFELE